MVLDDVRASRSKEPYVSPLASQRSGYLPRYLCTRDWSGVVDFSVAQGLGSELGAAAVGDSSEDLDEFLFQRCSERIGSVEHLSGSG